MLQVGLFRDFKFKGINSLLLWGDTEGLAHLQSAIATLSRLSGSSFQISGSDAKLSIVITDASDQFSELSKSEHGWEWVCSRATLDEVAVLIEGLENSSDGHQYIDVKGLAEEVIISKNEYPPSLRPK